MRRVYLYSLYERLWHWLQALCILGLLLTGVEIHWPDVIGLTGFAAAITIHNVLGFLLLGNAFLALFYHLSTGAIRQFLPEPRDFFTLAARQLLWYVRGIFRREPHPFERDPLHKLNPLQKITYLAILNILLLLQMVAGLLMWAAQRCSIIGWCGRSWEWRWELSFREGWLAGSAKGLPADAIKVVMSNDEQTADAAAEELMARGVRNAYVLAGGINHWLEVYGQGVGKPIRPVRPDTLRYEFRAALGANYPAADPDRWSTPQLPFTPKVHFDKPIVKLSGGCGG